jgi:hypothetical protein
MSDPVENSGGRDTVHRRIGGFRNVLVVYGNETQHREVAALLRDIRLGTTAPPIARR